MILLYQTHSGQVLGQLAGGEILEYLALCESRGLSALARLVENAELNPPGEYVLYRDEQTKATLFI